jgi:hypothetical protein
MLNTDGSWLVNVLAYFARLEGFTHGARDAKFNAESQKKIRDAAVRLRNHINGYGVPATVGALDEIVRLTEKNRAQGEDLWLWTGQGTSRLQDELKSRHVLMLDDKECQFYNEKPHQTIQESFPDSIEDLEEAAKCFALRRFTGTVFHLMRAMECAVQLLAQEIGVTNLEREWGKLLSDLGAAIEKMPKGKKRDAWSESHSHLYHVKQAWRNTTMHPKKTYTAEESETVLAAVRSFMRHLAPLIPAGAKP